jgi:hypothetical protein
MTTALARSRTFSQGLAVGLTLLLGWTLIPLPAMAAGTMTFKVDLQALGKTVTNKSSNINYWNLDGWAQPDSLPADHFSVYDPYVRNVDLMTATGGSAERDLFVDPNDRSTLTDYKFDTLIAACANIVRQGLKPKVTTGNVPLKYSTNPVIGPFGVNVSPPDDYNVYYNYIKAMADALKARFGLAEMRTWTWGVLTEYENRDWFDAGDANTTKLAYFQLYDYTVAALQDSLGAANVFVGAHSVTFAEVYWDEKEFINHCATGSNTKTGAIGTQLNYLSITYYDGQPSGFDSAHFISAINDIRDYANALGLTELQYGVDEGRVLSGWDDRPLLTRDVAHCAQGSADAKMFKVLVDNDVDWFSQWEGQQTQGFWGARTVAGNIRDLVYRMTGEQLAGITVSGAPASGADEVEAMATYDAARNVVHVLVYNNNPDPNATGAETITLDLVNLTPSDGTVRVKKWIVDETHANWWSTWWQDQTSRGLSDDAYVWSKYSSMLPGNLLNQADVDYWNSRLSVYTALGELVATTEELPLSGGSLSLVHDAAHHGVVFYEITDGTSTDTDTGDTDTGDTGTDSETDIEVAATGSGACNCSSVGNNRSFFSSLLSLFVSLLR